MSSQGGRHDELKEWLTKRWESSDSDNTSTAVTPTAGVKRKASDVLGTPADSTDDVFMTGPRSSSVRRSSASRVSKNNMILASLLATRASTEQPVVNTLSIGSIATVTPQISLLKRAPADQVNSMVGDLTASSCSLRRSSSSSVSSLASMSAAGDTSTVQNVCRSYSQPVSRGPNPTLAEANLPYQDTSLTLKSDAVSQDIVPTADMLETSNALSLMDDPTLLSQLEQFFTSPGGMLSDLETLLGDGYTDLTSLFAGDQPDQLPVTGVESSASQQQNRAQQQCSAARSHGVGLLGQLLGSVTDSSSTSTVTSDAFHQRPSSLAVSSAYFQRGICRYCLVSLSSWLNAELWVSLLV